MKKDSKEQLEEVRSELEDLFPGFDIRMEDTLPPDIEILRPYVERLTRALGIEVLFWSGMPLPVTAFVDEEDVDWIGLSKTLGVPINPEKDTDVDIARRMLDAELS